MRRLCPTQICHQPFVWRAGCTYLSLPRSCRSATVDECPLPVKWDKMGIVQGTGAGRYP